MRGLKRAAAVIGIVFVAACAYAVWYVYGAWPVPDGYEFPRHSIWGGGPDVLLVGELVDEGGCIRAAGGGGTTIVWPPGFSLSIEDGQPVVHGAGRNVGMGAVIRLVGGEYTRSELRGVAEGAGRTRCPAPFFLTTGYAD